MNREIFDKIFDETESKWDGDNCYAGLQIIAKYTDNPVMTNQRSGLNTLKLNIVGN